MQHLLPGIKGVTHLDSSELRCLLVRHQPSWFQLMLVSVGWACYLACALNVFGGKRGKSYKQYR